MKQSMQDLVIGFISITFNLVKYAILRQHTMEIHAITCRSLVMKVEI